MRSTVRLSIALVLTTAWSAAAGTLITSPFPGYATGSGVAYCTATNVGTSDALASVDLINTVGTALDHRDVTLLAGGSAIGAAASLSTSSPVFCRFDFKGKVRGSFSWVSGGTITVIPATK